MQHYLSRRTTNGILLAAFLLAFTPIFHSADAQDQPVREAYLTPPSHIASEVTAPRHENVRLNNLSPNGEYFLNTTSEGIPPLAYFARDHYNLAGHQIDPRGNRSRSMSTSTTTGLEVIEAQSGATRTISTPADARVSGMNWSPDGSQVAYLAHYEDETHVYVADAESGQSERVTQSPVLATLSTSLDWSGDGNHLFAVVTPNDFGTEPVAPKVPSEPRVRKTTTEDNRLRTYPRLLRSKHEEDLLEYYTTGQLVRIDVNTAQAENIGEPAMIRSIDAAPDGEHVIVQIMEKPFSHFVPVSRFSWNEEVWDLGGESLVTLREAQTHLSVPDFDRIENEGRSNIKWRPDGEGLSFIQEPEDDEEDEDGEDNSGTEEDADNDDQIYQVVQWLAPFGDGDQHIIYESDDELDWVNYSAHNDALFIQESSGSTDHVYAVYPDDADETYTIYEHDSDDFYQNPGSLEFTTNALGQRVVRTTTDGSGVYLSGRQYHEDYHARAPQPFLDLVRIQEGESERLFESSKDIYEDILAILDDDAQELIVERQNATTLPDSWLYNRQSESFTQLTENVDYNEAVTQAQRERFKITRADGFEFWTEVVMPVDWDGEEALPGLIWHYPREYDDQEDYNESARTHNLNQYPRVGTRTADILVKHGYAVIKPDWPISGERGTANDNFVWSITQNSTAVIDAITERGFADRDLMAIGGHSYGAFGTANAMIHTSFFRAGIAGNGNYNRTLTPMGFQRERDDLWRGQDRYLQMSPIFWAERMDGALLMYHGAEDQNVGTFPINSERMLHALNGIGKTAALYMYPNEAHGPAAEETLLDLWTRWADWLDHYVKNKGEAVTEEELQYARTSEQTPTDQ